MAPVRKNGDTVEVSAKAFNFVVSVLTAGLLGIGGVFWSLSHSHAVLTEQFSQFKKFMDAGGRWTRNDGERNAAGIEQNDQRLRILEQNEKVQQDYKRKHEAESRTGFQRIQDCEKEVAALRSRTDHNMQDIRELRGVLGH